MTNQQEPEFTYRITPVWRGDFNFHVAVFRRGEVLRDDYAMTKWGARRAAKKIVRKWRNNRGEVGVIR